VNLQNLSDIHRTGGGLYKLEPGELANASGDIILKALPEGMRFKSHRQLSLFSP